MNNRLKGKLALITGAANGIGAAVAKVYAREGAQLVLVDKDIKGLEEVDDEIQSLGTSATLVPLDLKNSAKIEELAIKIADRFKKLDILVGNAATLGQLGPVTDLHPTLWQEVLDVNLTANWHLLRNFDPLLKKAPAGRAIFVTSYCGKKTMPYWSAYSISKSALEMMVNLYAQEVKNTYPSLNVTLVDPGVVKTDLRLQAMPGEAMEELVTPDNIAEDFLPIAA